MSSLSSLSSFSRSPPLFFFSISSYLLSLYLPFIIWLSLSSSLIGCWNMGPTSSLSLFFFLSPSCSLLSFSIPFSLIVSIHIQVKGAEIGVISPYRRQVEKIREKLRSKGGEYLKVTVGSTEEFQASVLSPICLYMYIYIYLYTVMPGSSDPPEKKYYKTFESEN